MNINAKELLMLDRAKFAKMNNQSVPTTTSTESPVTNPQAGMKALEIQANNNIAFQGGMTMQAQKAVKKLAPMLAALALAGSAASCIKMDQYMEADFSAITELFSQMMDQMKESDKKILEMLQKMYDESVAQGKSDKEFQETVLKYFETDAYAQEQIINALVKNGKTQEEANAWLEAIFQEVADGNMSVAEALDMIFDKLGSIDETVKNILDQVVIISDKITKFNEDFIEARDSSYVLMGRLIEIEEENGNKISINGEKLDSLITINTDMAEDVANIEHELYEILQIAKDPVAFKEFISQLNSENMAKVEELFNMLGIDLTDVINKAKEDLTGAMKDVQGAVETFNKENTALEKEQIELQKTIVAKLESLDGKLDDLNAVELAEIAILKEQFEALKGLGGNAVDELKDINTRLDKVIAMLTSIYDAILSIGDDVKAIKDGQVVIMDAMSDGFASLLKEGQIHTAQMDKINANIEKGNGILANLEQNSKDWMAIAEKNHEELVETIKNLKLGDEEYARFEAMFKALGLEMSDVIKMSGSELKAAIEKFNNEYVVLAKEQLEVEKTIADKIDALSGKIDGLSAAQKEALKEIVSQFEALKGDMNKNLDDVVAELRDIDAALDGIQATLNILVEQVAQIGKDIASYKDSEAATVEILNKMFENDKVQTDFLYMLVAGQKTMNDNIVKLENTTYATYEQVKNNHAEFIEALKNLQVGTPDYTNMEEALKAVGLSIEQAIKMNADQLEAALKGFIDTYIATEKEQTAMMGEIKDAIKDVVAKFPGYDMSAIKEAIAMLTDAVKAGDANNVLMFQYVLQELAEFEEIVKAGFADLGSQMGTMKAWMTGFDNKFGEAVDAIINNMGANTDKIVEQQKYTNNYMQNLNETAEEVKDAIKDLAGKTAQGEGITLEQLEKLWVERDADNYAKYSALFEKLGINLDKSTATVVDAIEQLGSKIDLRADYTEQLNQIIDLLVANNAELAGNAEKVAEIKELLKNMKLTYYINVDCACGDESYTGDDYSKVEDMFQ